MTPDELAAIRARVEAATKGPWEATGHNFRECAGVRMPGRRHMGLIVSYDRDDRGQEDIDAEFIARARQDVPALLDEVERLQAALEAIAEDWDQPQCSAYDMVEIARQALKGGKRGE